MAERPTPPLTDFDRQVAKVNEVFTMSDEEVERLAAKVKALGTSTPPLTEEELAGITEYWRSPTGVAQAPPGMVEYARFCTGRLIADLHASRAEVERLGRLCGDYATEVGRLRAQNAEYVDFIATVVRVPNAP